MLAQCGALRVSSWPAFKGTYLSYLPRDLEVHASGTSERPFSVHTRHLEHHSSHSYLAAENPGPLLATNPVLESLAFPNSKTACREQRSLLLLMAGVCKHLWQARNLLVGCRGWLFLILGLLWKCPIPSKGIRLCCFVLLAGRAEPPVLPCWRSLLCTACSPSLPVLCLPLQYGYCTLVSQLTVKAACLPGAAP